MPDVNSKRRIFELLCCVSGAFLFVQVADEGLQAGHTENRCVGPRQSTCLDGRGRGVNIKALREQTPGLEI